MLENKKEQKPNIVIIYADDLGFGDVGCYGAVDIPTPNIDALAVSGIQFQQGYAAAATCTPARYSLLTGTYPYRHPRASILAGDAPSLFVEKAKTLPQKLKSVGYKTGVVGKWHLGLGNGDIDWNDEIEQTPNDIGFDSSYIMAATNDRVPCVYLKNRKVDHLDPNDPISVSYKELEREQYKSYPTGRDNPEQLSMMYHHGHDCTIVNGVSRIGYMKGGEKALWNDETMCDVFTDKAKSFIDSSNDDPFFLYYALHQPHVPRIPAPRFVGSTDLGPRGDVIVELDWCVGQIMEHLEQSGLKENTIVVFSSDNGPVLNDGYCDGAVERAGNHRQTGGLRGGKYSLFDAGTHVPFILSWPKEVKAAFSQAVVCQTDLYASLCSLIGMPLDLDEALDSEELSEAFFGKTEKGREELVTEGSGHKTLLRHGDWVFIPPYKGRILNENVNIETGNSEEPQLYHISKDAGQLLNLAHEEPERLLRMKHRLEEILASSMTRKS